MMTKTSVTILRVQNCYPQRIQTLNYLPDGTNSHLMFHKLDFTFSIFPSNIMHIILFSDTAAYHTTELHMSIPSKSKANNKDTYCFNLHQQCAA